MGDSIYKLSKLSDLEAVVDTMAEQYNQLQALLHRLVDEFEPVEYDYGRPGADDSVFICGYCEKKVDERTVSHRQDCAWRAAKQYLEEQKEE